MFIMKRFIPFLVIALLAIPVILMASTTSHLGKIVDKYGEAIIGATIRCLDCQCTLISDMDGNFDYTKHIGHKVSVSYIGYKTQTIILKPNIVITLYEDTTQIE